MTDPIREHSPLAPARTREVGETQESIVKWMFETFPGADPESPRKAIRALEEMVELCLASGASAREVTHAVHDALSRSGAEMSLLGGWSEKRVPSQPDKIPAEAADVLIVLYGVAGLRGFDLHAEVDRKMTVNRARRWAPRGDGTGYHIRDDSPSRLLGPASEAPR